MWLWQLGKPVLEQLTRSASLDEIQIDNLPELEHLDVLPALTKEYLILGFWIIKILLF